MDNLLSHAQTNKIMNNNVRCKAQRERLCNMWNCKNEKNIFVHNFITWIIKLNEILLNYWFEFIKKMKWGIKMKCMMKWGRQCKRVNKNKISEE